MHTNARPIYFSIFSIYFISEDRDGGELVRTNSALEHPPENGWWTQYSFNSAEMIDFVEIQSDRVGLC